MKKRASSDDGQIRLAKGINGQPQGTTHQLYTDMDVIFPIRCSKRCRSTALKYITDELFLYVDIDMNSCKHFFIF